MIILKNKMACKTCGRYGESDRSIYLKQVESLTIVLKRYEEIEKFQHERLEILEFEKDLYTKHGYEKELKEILEYKKKVENCVEILKDSIFSIRVINNDLKRNKNLMKLDRYIRKSNRKNFKKETK